MNVHFKMSNAAIVIKINYGVAYPHSWKAINFITCQSIALSGYTFY
ncbi:MAG TPA: hypothetical protein VK787_13360 [Puia sp.]|nr:hypothetical protein [Puia sp.]